MSQTEKILDGLSDFDLHLFNEGSHFRLYDILGAHPAVENNISGVRFAVWAPNAEKVSVVGGFNNWNTSAHFLTPLKQSGIWCGVKK